MCAIYSAKTKRPRATKKSAYAALVALQSARALAIFKTPLIYTDVWNFPGFNCLTRIILCVLNFANVNTTTIDKIEAFVTHAHTRFWPSAMSL